MADKAHEEKRSTTWAARASQFRRRKRAAPLSKEELRKQAADALVQWESRPEAQPKEE